MSFQTFTSLIGHAPLRIATIKQKKLSKGQETHKKQTAIYNSRDPMTQEQRRMKRMLRGVKGMGR